MKWRRIIPLILPNESMIWKKRWMTQMLVNLHTQRIKTKDRILRKKFTFNLSSGKDKINEWPNSNIHYYLNYRILGILFSTLLCENSWILYLWYEMNVPFFDILRDVSIIFEIEIIFHRLNHKFWRYFFYLVAELSPVSLNCSFFMLYPVLGIHL